MQLRPKASEAAVAAWNKFVYIGIDITYPADWKLT